MFKNKKVILAVLFVFTNLSFLFSYELTFKLSPGAFFPFLSRVSDQHFTVAAVDGFFDTGVNLANMFNVGVEFGYMLLPKQSSSELEEGVTSFLSLIPVGLHAEAYWYPLSRMELNLGLGGGVAMAVNGNKTMYAPWAKVNTGALFRINPSWSLGLDAHVFAFQAHEWFGMPAVGGVSVGATVKFTLETQKVTGNVSATISQDESIFPLMSSLYKENQFGSIFVENNESAEIRNVKVYFRTENFTASDLYCGSVDVIHKHKTAELPLLGDFNERIMQFSEAGDIPGEIVIDYEILGKKRSVVSSVVVSVYNRNQVRWTDPNVLASYISTNSQEVLELSKYLVGIARNQLRTGLNRNMQFAMYLFEGIRLSGIECKPDNATPYARCHLDPDELDYIQYPFQTMLYKSGDVDDTGILFMAMLASVGVDTGFIPMSDDFIVLVNLKLEPSKVGTLFDGSDRVLILDDSVMIPVSMSTLREGFVNSWYNALVRIMGAAGAGEDVTFYSLSDAWQYYPPAAFSSGSSVSDKPIEAPLVAAVETDMSRYITAEFGPQIAAVQNQIRAKGMSVELLNKLALLYVRAGMYSSAIPVYERSAAMGSVSAMTNLGNIAVIQRRFADGKVWYERALALEPDNKTALRGLNRVLGQLEE